MKILVDNYEKRIKNFIIKLAEKPIIVKKLKNKLLTSREDYYAKNSNKIIDKKGFSFKFYKTEKERIDEYVNEKEKIDNYLAKNSKKKEKAKSLEVTLIQPSMRFKARSDLERVYDILKNRENFNQDKKIVQKQLDNLGYISKNYEAGIDDDDDEEEEKGNNLNNIEDDGKYKNLSPEEKRRKILHNKIINDRKNMIERRKLFLTLRNNKKKSKDENKKIIHLREELHQKLYFKALENLTMFKTSTMNHNLFKIWSKEDIKTQKNIAFIKNNYYTHLSSGFNKIKSKMLNINSYSHRNKRNKNIRNEILEKDNQNIYKTDDNNKKNSDIFNKKFIHNKNHYDIFSNKKILEDLQITKDIVNSNPLLYNYNFSETTYMNDNKNIFSDAKMNNLKQIAFNIKKDEDSEVYDIMENELPFDDLKKEENIIIDGKYFKKSETYEIADRILKKCNWNKKKVKYKGNFEKGKLMFTNGMILKDFEEKYGISP